MKICPDREVISIVIGSAIMHHEIFPLISNTNQCRDPERVPTTLDSPTAAYCNAKPVPENQAKQGMQKPDEKQTPCEASRPSIDPYAVPSTPKKQSPPSPRATNQKRLIMGIVMS